MKYRNLKHYMIEMLKHFKKKYNYNNKEIQQINKKIKELEKLELAKN